jgi:hypothetical protein
MTQPAIDSDTTAQYRSQANETRRDYVAAVSIGVLSVDDVLDAAIRFEPALRRLNLGRLLMAQRKVGPTASRRILTRMLSALEAHPETRDRWSSLTVGWLCDQRTGGRRYVAFRDAIARETPRHSLIPVGFPYTPLPNRDRTNPASTDEAPRPPDTCNNR